jgi:phytoene dehydrogenase-like protein
MKTDYDVIVIGSGAGGLAAAVPLAQAGKKVLVCEQHDVPGGWCHSFTLNGYRFSPGVHYIGNLQPGGRLRSIYEGLGVSEDLIFCELNPDGFDHIIVGDEQFDIPRGKEKFAERLKERFPEESAGIQGYLDTLTELMDNLGKVTSVKGLKSGLQAVGAGVNILRWSRSSGQDLIDHFVSNPLLKAILSGQSGDHGLPPSQVSAFVHAGITHHYFNGGYFPKGGGFAIPRAFVRALKRAGGEIRLKTSVDRILIEDGRAVGIQLMDGTTLRADHIISNADPEVTFGKLIGRDNISSKLHKKLEKLEYSTSSLSLFFAVDMDLKEAGLDSGNYWLYDHDDLDKIYSDGLTDNVLTTEEIGAMFLTVTTLKDPSKMHSGHHTCEAFAFVGYEAFQKWADEKSGEHAPDYEAMKEDLSWRMFQKLEKHIPGISQHIVYWSLGTPLTNEHYINTTNGNLYGIAKNRKQVGLGAFPIQSEIDGLWMVGANTLSHGVAGATASGISAAQKILGCRIRDLLQTDGPPLQIYPSDDISQWSPELQKQIERRRQK